jgi:hypothetical protein
MMTALSPFGPCYISWGGVLFSLFLCNKKHLVLPQGNASVGFHSQAVSVVHGAALAAPTELGLVRSRHISGKEGAMRVWKPCRGSAVLRMVCMCFTGLVIQSQVHVIYVPVRAAGVKLASVWVH